MKKRMTAKNVGNKKDTNKNINKKIVELKEIIISIREDPKTMKQVERLITN